MCFVLLLHRVHPQYPILLAANREERRDRPSTPPHAWDGSPRIWAGRDELAGGTWLGVSETGMVVAVTNRRASTTDPGAPSRGGLCLGALRQPDIRAARRYVEQALAQWRFNPFNLICADVREAWVASWRGDIRPLDAGVHVVVSQGDIDDDSLPRVRRAHRMVRALDLTLPLPELLHALGRICADRTRPDPICRPHGPRGTVSSSLIAVNAGGRPVAYWHAEGPPCLVPYAPVADLETPIDAAPVEPSAR